MLLVRLLPLVLLLAACALTEKELAEREYREAERHARFLEFKKRCEAEGKAVVIRSRGRVRPDGLPGPGDRWSCQ